MIKAGETFHAYWADPVEPILLPFGRCRGQVIIFTESGMGPGRRDVKHRFLLVRDPPLRDHRRESGSFRRRQARSVP